MKCCIGDGHAGGHSDGHGSRHFGVMLVFYLAIGLISPPSVRSCSSAVPAGATEKVARSPSPFYLVMVAVPLSITFVQETVIVFARPVDT